MVTGFGWRPPRMPRLPRGNSSPCSLTTRTSNPGVALPIEPGRIGNSFELLPTTRLHSVWPNTSWASMPNVARTQSSNSPPRDSPPVKMLRSLTPGCLTSASRISLSAVGGRNTLRMPRSAIICIAACGSNLRARCPTTGTAWYQGANSELIRPPIQAPSGRVHHQHPLWGRELAGAMPDHGHGVVPGREQRIDQAADPGPVGRRPHQIAGLGQEIVAHLDIRQMAEHEAMRMQRALRIAGGARGEDDHRRIVGRGIGGGKFSRSRLERAPE